MIVKNRAQTVKSEIGQSENTVCRANALAWLRLIQVLDYVCSPLQTRDRGMMFENGCCLAASKVRDREHKMLVSVGYEHARGCIFSEKCMPN